MPKMLWLVGQLKPSLWGSVEPEREQQHSRLKPKTCLPESRFCLHLLVGNLVFENDGFALTLSPQCTCP